MHQSSLISKRAQLNKDLTELETRGKLKGRRAARLVGADECAGLVGLRRVTLVPDEKRPSLPDPSNDDHDFDDLGITVQTIR